ncbi:hypothetical protein BUALT_Bualt14G0087700 [Buddleja alternifolia]|uniref:Peptidase A1 domain-containing protein n=1 Tax=Buddleja alternifolia TaxID=168488 RepID=A0AAV6WHU1_9LAMI|nr:hypothetical protein BUALT_Bualt14G0087700 [Buddleja alternifolia]
MGSNRASVNVVLNFAAQSTWFGCENYTTSTYTPVHCQSRQCEIIRGEGCSGCNLPRPPRPGCTNDTCGTGAYNPFQGVLVSQGFGEDTLYSKDGKLVPGFIFSCMQREYREGLASGATGVGKLSVGGTRSSTSSISLKATPLIINPNSTAPSYTVGDPSYEYFIDVKSIRVDGKALFVKNSYFSFDKDGVGGTRISLINNFTAVHNSIYKPLARAFTKAASNMKIKSVAAVAPFRACFSSSSISRTPSGPSVPAIDLVLPGNDVYWRISGANSMAEIDRNTMCLAFVDGGSRPRTSIMIGAHQLEENFLEFNLVSSQLRFSSSLLVQNKRCSDL